MEKKRVKKWVEKNNNKINNKEEQEEQRRTKTYVPRSSNGKDVQRMHWKPWINIF